MFCIWWKLYSLDTGDYRGNSYFDNKPDRYNHVAIRGNPLRTSSILSQSQPMNCIKRQENDWRAWSYFSFLWSDAFGDRTTCTAPLHRPPPFPESQRLLKPHLRSAKEQLWPLLPSLQADHAHDLLAWLVFQNGLLPQEPFWCWTMHVGNIGFIYGLLCARSSCFNCSWDKRQGLSRGRPWGLWIGGWTMFASCKYSLNYLKLMEHSFYKSLCLHHFDQFDGGALRARDAIHDSPMSLHQSLCWLAVGGEVVGLVPGYQFWYSLDVGQGRHIGWWGSAVVFSGVFTKNYCLNTKLSPFPMW